jgi:predicted methyltransferase
MQRLSKRRWILWLLGVCAVVAAAAGYVIWPYWYADPNAQVADLIRLMQLRPGMTVAEIGAGAGEMTIGMAERLGPQGKVISTEIDSDKLAAIRNAASNQGLNNVTALEAAEKETSLPAECCDAVYMRRVYHHFTDPAAINRSLYKALRPGGRVAIIDFPPRLRWWPRPDGVPESRAGHGVPQELVIQEVTAAGFELEQRVEQWPGRDYCLLFRKPSEPPPSESAGP